MANYPLGLNVVILNNVLPRWMFYSFWLHFFQKQIVCRFSGCWTASESVSLRQLFALLQLSFTSSLHLSLTDKSISWMIHNRRASKRILKMSSCNTYSNYKRVMHCIVIGFELASLGAIQILLLLGVLLYFSRLCLKCGMDYMEFATINPQGC